MQLTDYSTGTTKEIDVHSILELRDRSFFREVFTGVKNICETKYTVKESIPEIMRKIREEKIK